MVAPKPVENPDFSALIDCVVKGHERSVRDGFEDEDFRQYVYEAAMEAVLGKDYFAWRNRQKW